MSLVPEQQQQQLPSGAWSVDPAHSSIGFVARHMMVSKVRGTFGDYDATIVVGDDPLQSSVTATVRTASIDTGDEQRNGHLRAPDFLDSETHPEMTFVSTGITGRGDRYELTGDLTIVGVTHPVTFDLEFNGTGLSPFGHRVAGFTATAVIKRKDFGLTWNQALETGGVLVGDKVTIELDIEATQPAE